MEYVYEAKRKSDGVACLIKILVSADGKRVSFTVKWPTEYEPTRQDDEFARNWALDWIKLNVGDPLDCESAGSGTDAEMQAKAASFLTHGVSINHAKSGEPWMTAEAAALYVAERDGDGHSYTHIDAKNGRFLARFIGITSENRKVALDIIARIGDPDA